MLTELTSGIIGVIIADIAFGLEIVAVLIILAAIVAALLNFIRHIMMHDPSQECIDAFKRTVGKGIQIALEMLIAADIIYTVVLAATLENVIVLTILVLIRTFLSWTLIFETEGRWPWNAQEKKKKSKKDDD
jgi:uncharacterized membrane protein